MERFKIIPAQGAKDIERARELFVEYSESIDADLCFQGFQEELLGLPGEYARPKGELLLAFHPDGQAIGCIAMRPTNSVGVCEMKRLYVARSGRRMGLGKALAEALIKAARKAGYEEMRLDTLPTMEDAQGLYEKLGFINIAPYYETPVAGTRFMGLRLDREK